MISDYLIGELSVRLEQLEAGAPAAARDVARLRYQVESGPLAGLAGAAVHALAMADDLCWDSLSRGDVAGFARQARASSDLRLFAVCAHLLAEDEG